MTDKIYERALELFSKDMALKCFCPLYRIRCKRTSEWNNNCHKAIKTHFLALAKKQIKEKK